MADVLKQTVGDSSTQHRGLRSEFTPSDSVSAKDIREDGPTLGQTGTQIPGMACL